MLEDNEIPDSILVDLDSIFDTRFPIALGINNVEAKKCIDNNSYFNRRFESFGLIPQEVFKAHYDLRNKGTLFYSSRTGILKLVKHHLIELVNMRVVTGSKSDLKVYLNIFPYDLNLTESLMMSTHVRDFLGGIDIEIINKDLKDITPNWLNKNVGTLFLYEGLRWFNIHMTNGNLTSCPLIDRTLYFPKLIPGNIKTKDATNELYDEAIMVMNTTITASPIVIKNYCLKK